MKLVRILVAIIAAVFLLWFVLPITHGIINLGNIAGIFICCCVIFRTGFSGIYNRIKTAFLKNAVSKVLLRVVQTVSTAFVIYAVVVSGFMVYVMNTKAATGATAVVLGAEVKPWGPSVLLRQRIDAAELYLNENPDTYAVVTGGQGSNEVMSEAQCMAETMQADGIDPDRIYPEDKAENTEQNIRYSLKIIDDNKLDPDLAVVTDSYHQLRASIIAHKLKPDIKTGAVNTANNLIGISTYPTYFVREWIAIPVEIIKPT